MFITFYLSSLLSADSPHPDSIETILTHNQKADRTFELSLDGPFAHLSAEEFRSVILMAPQDCSATENRQDYTTILANDPLPASFDWRDAGVISEVKNQGRCGSCWTFSSTGALEAHSALYRGLWRRSLLSEQQLLDCAQAFDNHGCNGGLPSHAFEYINYSGGLAREFAYPYEAKEGSCRFEPKNKGIVGVKTLRSFNVTEGDERSMMHLLVRRGPLSIAYQVVDDFRLYKSGVYSSKVCKQGPQDVNHAVLLVGYGEENGVPYWLVKNSWGDTWGEDGYFKIERGKNMCGVATCSSFPILDESAVDAIDDTDHLVDAWAE